MLEHSFRVWFLAGEELEGAGRLEHGHAAAIERPAAALARGAEQLRFKRSVDDLGDPEAVTQEVGGRGACRIRRHAHW